MLQKHTILVVSRDPHLSDVRKRTLENSGFHVLSAETAEAVRTARVDQKPSLVMIGYSVSPAEKRRVWLAAREFCKTPVLELHKQGHPELMAPAFFHEAHAPDDFVEAVKRVLQNPI